jgi:hypothetical protein
MTHQQGPHDEHPHGVRVAAVLRFAAALAALVAGALGAMALTFFALAAFFGRPAGRFTRLEALPPAAEPRLQADPPRDLREHRRREEALLSTAGWVDREAGVVRIPVERAMELVAERGLPHRASEERP